MFLCRSEKLFSNLFQRPAQQMRQEAPRLKAKGRVSKSAPVEQLPIVAAEATRTFDPMSSTIGNKVTRSSSLFWLVRAEAPTQRRTRP